jgi:DNA-binding MarR family transcriptional regulator
MLNDDLIWEVVGKSYRTIYNEKLGRQQRIPASLVEDLEQQGWIRRLPNPDSTRLNGWELTEEGKALAVQRKRASKAK